jgi:hypothetical protein
MSGVTATREQMDIYICAHLGPVERKDKEGGTT